MRKNIRKLIIRCDRRPEILACAQLRRSGLKLYEQPEEKVSRDGIHETVDMMCNKMTIVCHAGDVVVT